jgi:hypothetical protein
LKIVDSLNADKSVKCHLAAVKSTGALLRTPHEQRVDGEAVRASLRLRLRAAHRSLPEKVACPGCKIVLAAVDFGPHTAGCTKILGFNASGRHAAGKKSLDACWRACGTPYDTVEPRDLCTMVCPGCGRRCNEKDSAAHFSTCPRITAEQRKAGAAMRRSGPDGRVYFDDCSVVYDLTIVSPTAPSYVAHGPDHALAQRVAEKNKLYAAAVKAAGEEFVVAGATVFGEISAPLKALVLRAAASSNFDVDAGVMLRDVARDVCVLSGRVVSSAERRAGVVHHRIGSSASSAPAATPTPAPAAAAAAPPAPPAPPARTPEAPPSVHVEPPRAAVSQPAVHERAPRSSTPASEDTGRPTAPPPESRPSSAAEAPATSGPFGRPSTAFAQAFASFPASAQSSRSSSVSSFGQSTSFTTQGRPSTTSAFAPR